MKTVRIHQTGGPEVLNYEDAPEPSPSPAMPSSRSSPSV